ncbi:phosphatase PAP2 family protein [Wukongibacter baidiensis]|uniref:phosphatase PAP2 family protein n=1 Tax=Wukongibacter baidiensis TaxID=1723361 RepID=UPI003D7FA5EF
MFEYIDAIDKCVIDFFSTVQNEALIKIMSFFSFAGSDGLIWMVLICLLLISKKYRKIGCIAACAFLLSRITVDILKPLIGRPRPFQELSYLKINLPRPTDYSFPSGHATSSFATVCVLLNKIDSSFYKTLLILLAFFTSFSRLYLLFHYPSDILAGIIFGIICCQFALHYCDNNSL